MRNALLTADVRLVLRQAVVPLTTAQVTELCPGELLIQNVAAVLRHLATTGEIVSAALSDQGGAHWHMVPDESLRNVRYWATPETSAAWMERMRAHLRLLNKARSYERHFQGFLDRLTDSDTTLVRFDNQGAEAPVRVRVEMTMPQFLELLAARHPKPTEMSAS